jgi:hypothetical protein
MISSFFFSLHQFFHVLWVVLAPFLAQDLPAMDFYAHFCTALLRSSSYVPRSHIRLIRAFDAANSPIPTGRLLLDILCEQVSIRCRFASYPIASIDPRVLVRYLRDAPDSYANLVRSAFVNQRTDNSMLPEIPALKKLRNVPLVMSDRDIHTLCEIIGFDSEPAGICKALLRAHSTVYKTGYASFSVEVGLPNSELAKIPEFRKKQKDDPDVLVCRAIERLEYFAQVLAQQSAIEEWRTFILITHNLFIAKYAEAHVSASLANAKRLKLSPGQIFERVFEDPAVRQNIPLPVILQLLDVLPIVDPQGLLSCEAEMASALRVCPHFECPRPQHWMRQQLLLAFSLGRRVGFQQLFATLSFMAGAHFEFPQDVLYVRIMLQHVPVRTLLEAMAIFRDYFRENAFVRGILSPKLNASIDRANRPFDLVAKLTFDVYQRYIDIG